MCMHILFTVVQYCYAIRDAISFKCVDNSTKKNNFQHIVQYSKKVHNEAAELAVSVVHVFYRC